jgi:hypothetical protein
MYICFAASRKQTRQTGRTLNPPKKKDLIISRERERKRKRKGKIVQKPFQRRLGYWKYR